MKLPLSLLATLPLLASGVVHAAAPASGLATTPATLGLIPETRLPPAEVNARIDALKREPLRYAVPTALAVDERSGQWDVAAPGIARWRMRIESDQARSLSLLLKNVNLPEGASLWFYDAAGLDVQGPFDRHSANLVNRELRLPLVRSATAVLEVLVPLAGRNALTLKIAEAYHGYRDLTGPNAPKAAIGSDAGACNINVVCTEGDNWRNEIRSTVLLTVASTTLCSGSLVSNTRQDDRALLLTANHCNIRDTNTSQVLAYFNVMSTTCTGNQNGRVDQNLAGSTFLARDDNSDFTLFTLASVPPSAFNAYYAGWDARGGIAPQSGVTMHHPQGDEKKIAVYNSPATAVEDVRIGNAATGFNVDAWRVTWSRGTTEGGSSGSGLWNQNRQLVGVLSGGGASCDTPTEPDFFGRMDRAWLANSASSGQLKAHLDPINTGCLQLNSKNPGSASPLANCTGTTPTPTPGTTPATGSGVGGGGGGLPTSLLLGGLAMAGLRRRLRASRVSG